MRSEIRIVRELGAEFERVARRRRRRRWWLGPLLALLVGATATAVPATRAGIDDLANWLGGDDVGAPAGADDPAWLRSGARVIAESEGAKLYVKRDGDYLDFAVGEGFGEGATIEGWRKTFADRKVVLLGPASVHGRPWDERGRFPIMGVTARSVVRVEATFADGPPAVAEHVRGGYVIWVQARRRLREVLGYDLAGNVVGRVDASRIDLRRVCFAARGCPPARWTYAPADR